MPAPHSKRYESEYYSRYKKFDSRRPNTVKGEVTRSLSYADRNGSTPRAGLQSSQLGTIHEPPLQRKRIVPYEKNHNIFTTFTVKEQPDREWLKTDAESNRSHSPPDRRHKEESKRGAVIHRSETPILAAERKIFKEQPRNINRTVYLPDRIKRKSTYKGDFVDYKKQPKPSNGTSKKSKQSKQQQSQHKKVGGNKGEMSPDRLPPAGIRSTTSVGDTRLLKPSDDSQYLRSPEHEQKVFNTEYTSHYTQPTKFKYLDGLWIETPINAPVTYNVMNNNKKKTPDWFTQVLERRKEAYGYSQHARGTHFSRESDEMNREQAERASSRSESQRSYSPAEERRRGREVTPRSRVRSASPPRRREAWTEVRPSSPRQSDHRRVSSGTEATSDDDEMVLERGRSPTPELRDTRQSRRHHLDVTTDMLSDSFEKSLSISKKKKKKPYAHGHRDGSTPPPKEEKAVRPASPASSIGLGADATSYTPPRKAQVRSPPDPPGTSPVANEVLRDDDVLSVSAMSSRASVASETLERARKRRDEFWKRENASR